MKTGNVAGALIFAAWFAGPLPAFSADAAGPKRADFAPVLTVGAKWKVEVSAMSEAPSLPENKLVDWKPSKFVVVYRFFVEALEEVGSEPCFRISIDAPTDEERKKLPPFDYCYYWRIYLRQVGFTLKKVERLNDRTGRVEASTMFESGPVDATDWVGILPLAFPAFQEGQFYQEPPVKRRKDGSAIGKPSGHCLQTEERARIQVDGKEADALRITLEKKGNDGFPGHTTQTWVKGEPWWTEATYDRDGRQGRSARLLKE